MGCPDALWREPHPLFAGMRLREIDRTARYLYQTQQISEADWREYCAWRAREQARIQALERQMGTDVNGPVAAPGQL